MKKIGLFGGTFDPPHLAHTNLVDTVLDRGLFDQVWYLPVSIHQPIFAKAQMLGIDHRLAMLKLIQTPQTRIETFEIDSQKPSHTHDTLRSLSQLYSEHSFCFLMGSDQLAKLNLWNCSQDKQCFPACADEFEYYVYPRAGYPVETAFDNLKIIRDVEAMALSSTEIREMVSLGESIEGLVDPQIATYISEHKLHI